MDIRQPHLCGMSLLDVQAGLLGLGFDPGPHDGLYGPLTKDALRKCQAAYRLSVDGLPSPEIRRLLSLGLPAFRVTTRARTGQSLQSIARELDTTVEAVVEGNRRKRHEDVFTGEQLVVHRRAAAALDVDIDLDDQAGCGPDWTFVARSAGSRASARGCFGIVPLPDARWGAAAEVVSQARKDGLRGIILEIAGSSFSDDSAWKCLRIVRCVGRECRKAGLRLAALVSVCGRPAVGPAERSADQCARRPNGYDLEDIAAATDIVLMDVTDAGDPEVFRRAVAWSCRFVPRWKLMAVVELRPHHLGELGREPISGDDLTKLRARHVMRQGIDDSTGLCYLAYRARGAVRRIWRESAGSVGRKLHIVNRLNILGAAFRGVEDAEEQVLAEIGRRFIIM